MKVILFALIGAICSVIIAGGLSCMISEVEPSPTLLSLGAAAGGALGSAVSYSLEGTPNDPLSGFSQEIVPEMKIGIPMF